jgi:phosphatidate cytidylyltransferase
MFASTHIALFLIVVQAHFVMNNIFEGLIWFFLPASLVITNDIFAYICGITFGRTQLIKLSPKKTVEGFLGAWVFTIAFGYFITNVMSRYTYFVCPVNVCLNNLRYELQPLTSFQDLGANIWTGLQCDVNPVFLKQRYYIPFIPPTWSHLPTSFMVSPMQFHIFFLASFASLIAPFGGFFASGIKRTFKIKDFGDSIPGHGGVTDRMDCQFIMGTLTYMYYQGFIATHKASVGQVMEMAITGLTLEQQVEVVRGISKYLVNQGVITETVCFAPFLWLFLTLRLSRLRCCNMLIMILRFWNTSTATCQNGGSPLRIHVPEKNRDEIMFNQNMIQGGATVVYSCDASLTSFRQRHVAFSLSKAFICILPFSYSLYLLAV